MNKLISCLNTSQQIKINNYLWDEEVYNLALEIKNNVNLINQRIDILKYKK